MNSIRLRINFLIGLGLIVIFFSKLAYSASDDIVNTLKNGNVAVVSFPSDDETKPFQSAIQTRLETVLRDNGISVLDQARAEELRTTFGGCLDDPACVLTPEIMIEMSGKYQIHCILRAYVTGEVHPGLADYSTATAQADIRLVDKDANVLPALSATMGDPGWPASDGLNDDAALRNAIIRTIDGVCETMGLLVSDAQVPTSVDLTLEQVSILPDDTTPVPSQPDESLIPLADFQKGQSWRVEKATCTALAPGGKVGAVAGYIRDTMLGRRPERMCESKVHIVDKSAGKESKFFQGHDLGVGGEESREITACAFVRNWRYLIAVGGEEVFFWDVERGQSLKCPKPDQSFHSPVLTIHQGADGTYAVVEDKGSKRASGSMVYRITRQH